MRTKHMMMVGFLPLVVAGCGASALDQEGQHVETDGRDDVALVGKADGGYGPCEVEHLLTFVNDPGISVAALKAAGVHARAAQNLVATRLGADGVAGTADDGRFETLRDVDDVYYVGPKAMAQLVAAVTHLCEVAPVEAEVEVVFSPQPYDQSHLVKVAELIDAAERSIDVAMYSFSDGGIMRALEDAVLRGVSVRMIFHPANGDHKAPAGTRSGALEAMGIDVRYVNKIMHHKFALIDGPRASLDEAADSVLISGSGNWSNSAGTRYDENTVFHYGQERLTVLFQQEFNHLWANSRDLVANPDLTFFASLAIADADVPADDSVDAAFTSANFRTYVSSAYGPTFSTVAGRDTVADRLVALIERAEASIYVASGHLRSRPIAEALLAKAAANPDLDIRVYLDGQEYVSEWFQDKQERELDACLEAAGASVSKQQKCTDKGYYFGYELHEAPGVALRYKYYAYRWDYSYAKQMHHKYLVIDERVLATGSYNQSDNAEHNTFENVVIYDGAAYPELVAAYVDNFEALWATGEADGLFAALMADVTDGSGPVPLVFDAMALDTEQITVLKRALRDACPEIDSNAFRTEPARHQLCWP